jgi:hypothetical protein
MVVSFWQQINFDQFNDFNHGQDYFLKTKNQEKYFSGILVLIFNDIPKY